MLPRHLHRLGRDWVARAEHPKSLRMNRHFFRSPWWTGHHPRTPYTPGNAWHPPVEWRPHHFFVPSRAQYQNPSCVPWNPRPSAWLHTSHLNMASKADEPLPKRVKSTEESRHGRKVSSKRSYSPTKDFRVPPIPDPSAPVTDSEEDADGKGNIRRGWEDFSQYYTARARDENDSRRCTESFDFTVLSYNILSQDLLEDNAHLYSHCRRPLLFWSYRLPNILNEIEEMDADILCLQEVQEDHYRTQIKPSLEALGYHCEYKTRTGSKPDGCAICFKSSKFILALTKPVEYYRRNIALLDRDNIGLVLLLQPRTEIEAPTICVANTHLLYNPKRGDIKLTQLAILLAEISGAARLKDMSYCPIVLCGDFNSVPGSPLHRFIRDGMLNYAGLSVGRVSGQEKYPTGKRILSIPIWPKSLGISQNCVYETKEITEESGGTIEEAAEDGIDKSVDSSLQHRFSLSSVYSHYIPGSGVPEVTTCHSRSAITVDYIFYSSAKDDIFADPGSDVSCNGLKLLGRLSLLTEKDLWSVNGLPNKNNSSDHLSLLAKFRLEI
ncbi:protein angel homolog 2 [Spea bombifrons]|uniref:protein angel homolog 2 n=1 Tax=Spea bombifrons TaxID=233779 RepID=UPI00234AF888|nr:protein angel homolog 2 [Spea bombifrons]